MRYAGVVAASDWEWMQHGACVVAGLEPEPFFPGRGEPAPLALRVCAGCAVRAECEEYAHREQIFHGIFGGTSEKQRRRKQLARPRYPKEQGDSAVERAS